MHRTVGGLRPLFGRPGWYAVCHQVDLPYQHAQPAAHPRWRSHLLVDVLDAAMTDLTTGVGNKENPIG